MLPENISSLRKKGKNERDPLVVQNILLERFWNHFLATVGKLCISHLGSVLVSAVNAPNNF